MKSFCFEELLLVPLFPATNAIPNPCTDETQAVGSRSGIAPWDPAVGSRRGITPSIAPLVVLWDCAVGSRTSAYMP